MTFYKTTKHAWDIEEVEVTHVTEKQVTLAQGV